MNHNIPDIVDISFIGSGIATAYTLLELVNRLEAGQPKRAVTISVYDKYPEFFCGIPYGQRSGDSVLLINALHNFLPESERAVFMEWLSENKSHLIKRFLAAGGVMARKWVDTHQEAINIDAWEPLFVPRSFFGSYILEKVSRAIRIAEDKGLMKLYYQVGEVEDVQRGSDDFELHMRDGAKNRSRKVVLSVGSLPTRRIHTDALHVQERDFLLINDVYAHNLASNLALIEKFLQGRQGKETNILIVGANASGLETLYKLADEKQIGGLINRFIVLSTHGLIPDSEVDFEKQSKFTASHLESLSQDGQLTAADIADAAFRDLKVAHDMKLGAASTVGIISGGFGKLLSKLNKEEQVRFACFHGNEIGRLQRCAGTHYTGVVAGLKETGRFQHIAGKFKSLTPGGENGVALEYIDTQTLETKVLPEKVHIVVNCIGSTRFGGKYVPLLFQNLFKGGICHPNESRVGISVNEHFEGSENFYVAGPMLAGNVLENKPLWHLEHCGRIIWTSRLLASKLNVIN